MNPKYHVTERYKSAYASRPLNGGTWCIVVMHHRQDVVIGEGTTAQGAWRDAWFKMRGNQC